MVELIGNKNAVRSLIGFLQATQIGGREGANKMSREWEISGARVVLVRKEVPLWTQKPPIGGLARSTFHPEGSSPSWQPIRWTQDLTRPSHHASSAYVSRPDVTPTSKQPWGASRNSSCLKAEGMSAGAFRISFYLKGTVSGTWPDIDRIGRARRV